MDNAFQKAREEKLRKTAENIVGLLKKVLVEEIDFNAETKNAFNLLKCFDESKQEKVSEMVLKILELQPSVKVWGWLKKTLGQAIISGKSVEEIEEDLDYSKIKIAEKLKDIKKIANSVEEITDEIVGLDAYLIITKEIEKFEEIAKYFTNAIRSPNYPSSFLINTESAVPPETELVREKVEKVMEDFPKIKKAAEEILDAISKHDEELDIYAKKLIENRMATDPEIRKVTYRGLRALEQLRRARLVSKALLDLANKF